MEPTFSRCRVELPGNPRRVLRGACEVVEAGGVAAAETGAWARVAGAPRAVVEAWAREDEVEAAAITRAWLRPAPATTRREVVPPAEQVRRAGQCRERARVWYADLDGSPVVRPMVAACNTRACLVCGRRRLRAVFDRLGPLYMATPGPGYHAAFITVGSVGHVRTAADVRGYLRRIGRVQRALREGVASCGIPPRSWVAGTRACELRPRDVGGWTHVHWYVISRDYVPYGLSLGALPAHPAPEQRGIREVLRRAGVGEVIDVRRVAGTGDVLADYASKIQHYASKIDGGEADEPWDGRMDLLQAMRGTRIVASFGDARGLLAGPTRGSTTEDGAPLRYTARGPMYDPADATSWRQAEREGHAGLTAREVVRLYGPGPGVEVVTRRVTGYVGSVLDGWRDWCDVEALRAHMSAWDALQVVV